MSRRGALVLVRHGRTAWSAAGRITGWEDPPLDELGEHEARRVGTVLAARGFRPAVVLTSCAGRARRTAELAAEAGVGGQAAVHADWRLNERHFGQLQGLDRRAARERFGKALVRACSIDPAAVPPQIARSDRRHPVHDAAYGRVDPARLPGGESLAQLAERVLECWHELAEPPLRRGVDVLVVSHCHALRALVRHLGGGIDSRCFSATGSALLLGGGAGPIEIGGPVRCPA